MTSPPGWELLYVLDSLDLQAPFEADYLVFAGRRDLRVAMAVVKEPAAALLLDGFTDAAGREKAVTALLVREDAPRDYRNVSAIRNLRNLFAVSSVIAGCQAHLNDLNGRGFRVLYSSFFRFYPIQLSRDGTKFLTDAVAFRNFDDVRGFKGQVSPFLPNTPLVDPRPDEVVAQRLLAAWRATIGTEADHRTTSLFRSLDIAFHAASVPETESVFEMGIRVGLWVSAFEVLAHARSGQANLNNVLSLLGGVAWSDRLLRSDCVTDRGRPLSLVPGIYADLYRARNDYVHGNPVGRERPYTFKDQVLPPLLWTAPIVYKVALHQYLSELGYPQVEMQRLFQQGDWETALLKVRPASPVVLG